MTAPKSVDSAALWREQIESASPDLLRAMIKTFADAMMSAEADALCGAGYGERSPERVNSRNGYRAREWDTRAGTVELAIPKLRQGSYFPDWLLQHRRRAEQALVSVVATSYLLGVSTRRVEKLAEQLGIRQLSKSQVSEMAQHLDTQVEAFRNRPLDSGHYTFVWVDALVIKVREHGRTVNVHALIAVGVNADGGREVLGLDIASDEDGAGWLAFLRSLTAAGCPGCGWSSPTPTAASSRRSAPRCPAPRGSGAARTEAVKNQPGAFWEWPRWQRYGDPGYASCPAGLQVRGAVAAPERAAAASGVSDRGAFARTWRCALCGADRRGQRDHGAPGCLGVGSWHHSGVRWSRPCRWWGPTADRGHRPRSSGCAVAAGRAGRAR